jgi:elongation factor G
MQIQADKRVDLTQASAGEIVAAIGLNATTTGDTLCSEEAPFILEPMKFPAPVISVAIEPKTTIDIERLGVSLSRLADEDPTFKMNVDQETGQTIVSGMGELHLEIIVDRLLREFNVEANVGRPQVAYRETVSSKATAEGKLIRQTGGRGQYGRVTLHLEPLAYGSGFEFVNKIVGGAIPKEFISAVDDGIRGALPAGVLAGYPVIDVRATLVDGSYHEVDSSYMAFQIAGSIAFKEAFRQAHPVLLEPVMSAEIEVPEEYTGDVIADMASRRGQIQGMDANDDVSKIRAHVPLSEMFGYATNIRNRTKGRGSFVMELSHYEAVPREIAVALIEHAFNTRAADSVRRRAS